MENVDDVEAVARKMVDEVSAALLASEVKMATPPPSPASAIKAKQNGHNPGISAAGDMVPEKENVEALSRNSFEESGDTLKSDATENLPNELISDSALLNEELIPQKNGAPETDHFIEIVANTNPGVMVSPINEIRRFTPKVVDRSELGKGSYDQVSPTNHPNTEKGAFPRIFPVNHLDMTDLTAANEDVVSLSQQQNAEAMLQKETYLVIPNTIGELESTAKSVVIPVEISSGTQSSVTESFEIPVQITMEPESPVEESFEIPVQISSEPQSPSQESFGIPVTVATDEESVEDNEDVIKTNTSCGLHGEASEYFPQKKESLAYSATIFMDRMSMGQITDVENFSQSWLRNFEEQLVPLPLGEVQANDRFSLSAVTDNTSNNITSAETFEIPILFETSLTSSNSDSNTKGTYVEENQALEEFAIPVIFEESSLSRSLMGSKEQQTQIERPLIEAINKLEIMPLQRVGDLGSIIHATISLTGNDSTFAEPTSPPVQSKDLGAEPNQEDVKCNTESEPSMREASLPFEEKVSHSQKVDMKEEQKIVHRSDAEEEEEEEEKINGDKEKRQELHLKYSVVTKNAEESVSSLSDEATKELGEKRQENVDLPPSKPTQDDVVRIFREIAAVTSSEKEAQFDNELKKEKEVTVSETEKVIPTEEPVSTDLQQSTEEVHIVQSEQEVNKTIQELSINPENTNQYMIEKKDFRNTEDPNEKKLIAEKNLQNTTHPEFAAKEALSSAAVEQEATYTPASSVVKAFGDSEFQKPVTTSDDDINAPLAVSHEDESQLESSNMPSNTGPGIYEKEEESVTVTNKEPSKPLSGLHEPENRAPGVFREESKAQTISSSNAEDISTSQNVDIVIEKPAEKLQKDKVEGTKISDTSSKLPPEHVISEREKFFKQQFVQVTETEKKPEEILGKKFEEEKSETTKEPTVVEKSKPDMQLEEKPKDDVNKPVFQTEKEKKEGAKDVSEALNSELGKPEATEAQQPVKRRCTLL